MYSSKGYYFLCLNSVLENKIFSLFILSERQMPDIFEKEVKWSTLLLILSAVGYMTFSLGNFLSSEIFDLWLALDYHTSVWLSSSYLNMCNALGASIAMTLITPQVSPTAWSSHIQLPRGIWQTTGNFNCILINKGD